MSKKESRVRAHTRRTASGQSRVREGRRRRNIAIGAGVGTAVGLAGLGLAGRRLAHTVKRKQAIRNFSPQTGPVLNHKGRAVYAKNTAANQLKNSKSILHKSKINNVEVVKTGRAKINKSIDNSKKLDSLDPKGTLLAKTSKWNPDKRSRKQAGKELAERARKLRGQ